MVVITFESFYKNCVLLEYAQERYRVSFTKQSNHEIYHLDAPYQPATGTVAATIIGHGDPTILPLINTFEEWAGRHKQAALYAINVRPMDREDMMHLFRYKMVNDPLNSKICTQLSDWAVDELAKLLLKRRKEIQKEHPSMRVMFVRPESKSQFNVNVEKLLLAGGVSSSDVTTAIKQRMSDLANAPQAIQTMTRLLGKSFSNFIHDPVFARISSDKFSRDTLATEFAQFSGYSKLDVAKALLDLDPITWNMFQNIAIHQHCAYLFYDDNFSKGFTENHLMRLCASVTSCPVEYYVGLQILGRKTVGELDAVADPFVIGQLKKKNEIENAQAEYDSWKEQYLNALKSRNKTEIKYASHKMAEYGDTLAKLGKPQPSLFA